MNEANKENYRKMILNDLDFGIPVTYKRYDIKLEEFLAILSELKDDQLIMHDLLKDILPNGNPSPHYGDPKNIRLRK